MKIVILDAATLTINNDIDFSIFDRFGEVKIYDFTKDEEIPERIKDADVIFLDEPNSALDAISDYEISQLYQKLFQDKMGIIIAHKFNNLINQVNNILVIENGRLAESGTHTELLHQGKIYYEMYQLQNKNSAVL